MTPTKTTNQVAEEIGTTPNNLIGAIRNRRFPPPNKDAHGFYAWTADDVARARAAMAKDRRRGPRDGREAARAS